MKLQLWDTAGQERFRTLTDNYYSGASGIVLVYSITDRKSFEEINDWMIQINSKTDEDVPKIILANKCDVSGRSSSGLEKRVVELYEGRVLSEKYNTMFLEVSAKENINIDQAFQMLSYAMLQRNTMNQQSSSQIMTLNHKNSKQKESHTACCGS